MKTLEWELENTPREVLGSCCLCCGEPGPAELCRDCIVEGETLFVPTYETLDVVSHEALFTFLGPCMIGRYALNAVLAARNAFFGS